MKAIHSQQMFCHQILEGKKGVFKKQFLCLDFVIFVLTKKFTEVFFDTGLYTFFPPIFKLRFCLDKNIHYSYCVRESI